MSSLRFVTAALAAVVTLLGAASPAIAQPVERPPLDAPAAPPAGTIALSLDVAESGTLDAAELRAAVALELGLPVGDGTAFAPALGRLTISTADGTLRIAYQPASGTLVERTLPLPASPVDQVDVVTYVASNLVRDQTSELIAGLRDRHDAAPTGGGVTATIEPRHRTRTLPITLGILPPVALDRLLGPHVTVGVGIHAVAGVTDRSTILSVSGLVDVERESITSLQIAGLAAITARVDNGVQIAGLVALASKGVDGIQIGGLAAASAGTVDGAQIAGLATVARRDMHGMQIAGIAAIAHDVEGVQLAGIANVADTAHGVQLGLVNVARRMHGVQLGLVNVTEDGDDTYPIGLINYSKNGPVAVDAWVESTRISAIAFRHGTRHIHNVWGLGWSPDHDQILVGAGLGTHLGLADGIGLDIDAMSWFTDVWHGNHGELNQLRATVAVPIARTGIEVIAGAAANVYVSDDMDESADFHPVLARGYTSSGGTNVVSWPSLFAGIRLRAR